MTNPTSPDERARLAPCVTEQDCTNVPWCKIRAACLRSRPASTCGHCGAYAHEECPTDPSKCRRPAATSAVEVAPADDEWAMRKAQALMQRQYVGGFAQMEAAVHAALVEAMQRAQAERDAARAELVAAREDARRYRFLREQEQAAGSIRVTDSANVRPGAFVPSLEALDDVIDAMLAARAAAAGEAKP